VVEEEEEEEDEGSRIEWLKGLRSAWEDGDDTEGGDGLLYV
jgi:hypothetical protein